MTTASGVSSLSLALPPASILLVDQFSMDTANLSAHAQYEVSLLNIVSPNSYLYIYIHQVVCKAGEAKPKPVFSWTLDGKPLTGLETRDEEVRIIFLLSQMIISSVLGDGGH